MPTHTTHNTAPTFDANDEEQVRDLAIKPIERKHRFTARALAGLMAGVLLIVIWAVSEYRPQ